MRRPLLLRREVLDWLAFGLLDSPWQPARRWAARRCATWFNPLEIR